MPASEKWLPTGTVMVHAEVGITRWRGPGGAGAEAPRQKRIERRQLASILPVDSQANRYGSFRPSRRSGFAMNGHGRAPVGEVSTPEGRRHPGRVTRRPAHAFAVSSTGSSIGRLESIHPSGKSQWEETAIPWAACFTETVALCARFSRKKSAQNRAKKALAAIHDWAPPFADLSHI
ncbi:hypothetical protein [Candidatus Methylacidithermus pantelleriae]|nr:hypothetical protein [Candidatus Methylacidithermus pantelleriae]